MTLGGLVAIGSAVDDAIVDAENVYRCLRKNTHRNPIFLTWCLKAVRKFVRYLEPIITVVVFSPIFALSGVEGSIFIPMGLGYLAAVLASSVVALQSRLPCVQFCCLMVYRNGNRGLPDSLRESICSAELCCDDRPSFLRSLSLHWWQHGGCTSFGRIFLPEFQERSLINAMNLYPGVSLETTNAASGAFRML